MSMSTISLKEERRKAADDEEGRSDARDGRGRVLGLARARGRGAR